MLPKAPAGKLKLTSFSSCDPKTVPLKDGKRFVLTSETCHLDLSTSRLTIFRERLLANASRIASCNVSRLAESEASCAAPSTAPHAINNTKESERTIRRNV